MTATDPYAWFEALRWGTDAPDCPHCGALAAGRFLAPSVSRRTRTGAVTARRVWRCGLCRRQFSVLTGTVLEGTRVPLPTWAAVVAELAAGELSVGDVVARHSVSPDTARTMVRRAAAAVAAVSTVPTVSRGAGDPLAAVLRLPAPEVTRIRAASAPRVRRRGGTGPTADYR